MFFYIFFETFKTHWQAAPVSYCLMSSQFKSLSHCYHVTIIPLKTAASSILCCFWTLIVNDRPSSAQAEPPPAGSLLFLLLWHVLSLDNAQSLFGNPVIHLALTLGLDVKVPHTLQKSVKPQTSSSFCSLPVSAITTCNSQNFDWLTLCSRPHFYSSSVTPCFSIYNSYFLVDSACVLWLCWGDNIKC